jgi:hypothetical protein
VRESNNRSSSHEQAGNNLLLDDISMVNPIGLDGFNPPMTMIVEKCYTDEHTKINVIKGT